MIAQILAVLLAVTAPPAPPPVPGGGTSPRVCDGALPDPDNPERPVPVRVRLPSGPGPHPVILFSHGLGGSVEAGTRWATAWSEAGFAVIHLQHPGSDVSLWRGLRGQEALAALRKGMDAKQFIARVEDVKLVLDAVATPVAIGECPLSQLDSARIGIAGHSFGAQTVQALAGQQFRTPSGLISVGDPRIRAAIAFSPAPARAEPDESAFGKITMPFLSVTGTRDEVPGISDVSPKDRTRPFHAMPAGQKYLLVLDGADHMVFSGGEQRRPATSNDTRIERVVTEVSVAFWKAMLDPTPTPNILDHPAALGSKDRWMAK
ncbi:alpha/beta hydrolase family protein [Erythrobacter sp. BLCC-B19]|uniref:alpha/beta hydrolase family protein n=1 Tax=Erythrobacter sp. BLCC-B19 TaxID=3025315 RepID=UPI002361F594|nr:dienelactone hydrolase [Erythrobacter sp. BLCC-B19]WDA39634.1 dienelactone hydrolase [Erythrobacter sp. BLCC-B19]